MRLGTRFVVAASVGALSWSFFTATQAARPLNAGVGTFLWGAGGDDPEDEDCTNDDQADTTQCVGGCTGTYDALERDLDIYKVANVSGGCSGVGCPRNEKNNLVVCTGEQEP